jgi:thiol-disulfide isomerase/thioredoxin
MNKYILAALGLLVVIVAGGVYIIQKDGTNETAMQEKEMMAKESEDQMMAKEDAMMEKKDEAMMEKKDDAMMAKKGTFTPYSQAQVSQASADNKVVLFFNASWCPTCRATTKALNESGVPAGITVLSVDYDANVDLRKQYGVTQQHTFVQVDAGGQKRTSWTGSASGADIAAKVI